MHNIIFPPAVSFIYAVLFTHLHQLKEKYEKLTFLSHVNTVVRNTTIMADLTGPTLVEGPTLYVKPVFHGACFRRAAFSRATFCSAC